jgi:hypothetical protein
MVRFNECRGMCLCHFTLCLMHNCTLCIAMFVHTKLRITNKPFLDSEILILYCYFVGRQGIKYHYLQYNTCIIVRDFSLNSSKCIVLYSNTKVSILTFLRHNIIHMIVIVSRQMIVLEWNYLCIVHILVQYSKQLYKCFTHNIIDILVLLSLCSMGLSCQENFPNKESVN